MYGVCFFYEVFIHLFLISVKTFNNGILYVRIVSCMKINVLTHMVLLDSCIYKLSTLSDCIVISFLSRNKYFNAVVIDVPALSFSGTFQATDPKPAACSSS